MAARWIAGATRTFSTTRFPSSKNGKKQDWPPSLIGRFDRSRYEGTDADERRLFYVAITRARDAVLLSSFSKIGGNTVKVVRDMSRQFG